MRRTPAILSLLAGAALLLPSAPARAGEIYRWVDRDGNAHFTNVPNDRRYSRYPLSREGVRPQRPPRQWKYDGLIQLTAMEHDLPPALVKAVIAAESNFRPTAVSRKGAQGLMQLMPSTARSLGVEDAMRPSENVRGGTRYLKEMLDRFGDLTRALAAYNAGPEAVVRYGGVPPYPETRDYVDRVLNYYRHYYGDFGR